MTVRDGGGWTPSAVTLVIWRTGLVLRSAPATQWHYEELRLSPDVVAGLVGTAGQHRLLEPRDSGEPAITDQSTLLVSVDDGTAVHTTTVYAPTQTSGLTAEQLATRADVDALLTALAPLRDVSSPLFSQAPHPFAPDAVQAVAEPILPSEPHTDVEPVTPSAWPLAKPIAAVFAAGECVELSGGEAAQLRDAVEVRANPDRSLVVNTGDPIVAQLRLHVTASIPGSSPCYSDPHAVDVANTTWPADGRTKTSALDRWAAQVILHRVAFTDGLGRQAHNAADLTWYNYTYAAVSIGTEPFVDVTAAYNFSERDPARFSLRFDRNTGEVVEKSVG